MSPQLFERLLGIFVLTQLFKSLVQ